MATGFFLLALGSSNKHVNTMARFTAFVNPFGGFLGTTEALEVSMLLFARSIYFQKHMESTVREEFGRDSHKVGLALS